VIIVKFIVSYRIESCRVVYINRTIKGSERERGLSRYRVIDRGSGRSSRKEIYEQLSNTHDRHHSNMSPSHHENVISVHHPVKVRR
jgi:hypothetical protein